METHPWQPMPRSAGHDSFVTDTARWRRLTFAEFTSRIEREFGIGSTSRCIASSGFYPGDKLEPEDIRWFCDQVGLPAEDLGL